MKKLTNVSEITAKTAEEVKAQVEGLIGRYHDVVSDEDDAKKFFGSESEDLYREEVQRFTVSGEMNGDWQETITVVITAYYKDSGSDDYCYSVSAEED